MTQATTGSLRREAGPDCTGGLGSRPPSTEEACATGTQEKSSVSAGAASVLDRPTPPGTGSFQVDVDVDRVVPGDGQGYETVHALGGLRQRRLPHRGLGPARLARVNS